MNGLTHNIEASVLVRSTDDISQQDLLEVKMGTTWVLVESDIFGSWTGLRRVNGVEHHGPVTYIEGGLYRGTRVCGCGLCEVHVEPKFKKN